MLVGLRDACLTFDNYFSVEDVPEDIINLRPLVLSLSNPVSNTVMGGEDQARWLDQLSSAASSELAGSE